jgi:hypothetical protein
MIDILSGILVILLGIGIFVLPMVIADSLDPRNKRR